MGRRRDERPDRTPEPADLFAEAQPERVLIEEEYHYSQEISANRWTERGDAPTGHIDIRVPYDGVRHLPRSTAKALARRLKGITDDSGATIGHVVLTDHQHTDLAGHLALDRSYGAIPVRIPVRSRSLVDEEALAADRYEHRWSLDYAPHPDHPELLPLELGAEIEDKDTSGLQDIISEHAGAPAQRDFVAQMTRYIAFRPALTLVLTAVVTVSLPRHRRIRPPRVRRISVEMPAMTRLDGPNLTLTVHDHDHPVQYDAEHGCVEWFDVATSRPISSDDSSAASSDQIVRRSFLTAQMRLDIDQPGDLFDRDEVVVRAEVELPDLLLSGTQARLFDARGRRTRDGGTATTASRKVSTYRRQAEPAFRGRPRSDRDRISKAATDLDRIEAAPGRTSVAQRTIVNTRCAVSLRDAFARRAFEPHQALHFDEIIPTQERVADVEAVLTSLGFTTRETERLDSWDGRDPAELLWLIGADRGDQVSGENAAEIWIVIRGRKHSTRRQSERGAGTTYTTRVPTGELELFVRGKTLGNPYALMEQMNALHRLLKDRFRPMRSQR